MIAVFSCKHGRDEVNALFIENMRWLREHFNLELFMATTHGETFEEPWIHTIKHPNRPLGGKWNASIGLALACKEADRFVGMGDDDIISPESLHALIDTKEHHVGTKSVCFIDPYQELAVRSEYVFECDKLVGAGRTFTREAVENSAHFVNVKLRREINNGGHKLAANQVLNVNVKQAKYLVQRGLANVVKGTYRFEFFGHENNSGMDHTSDMNLVLANYLPKAIELPHEIVDVKTKENIWSYDRRKNDKGAKPIPYEEAISWFTPKLIDQLQKIKDNG
jgi:hypothetical protein